MDSFFSSSHPLDDLFLDLWKENRQPPPPPPRRASPPRPSLLLGGVPQCELELSKLQRAYRELLEKDKAEENGERGEKSSSQHQQQEWSRLVSRFRWLRETLVSCGAGLATPLGLAAAAAGADTALRARDWGEFLKSASYLASDGVTVVEESSSKQDSNSSASPCPSFSLYAPLEADALLLLYFSCVPPQPQSLDVATRLRALGMRRRGTRRLREGEEEKEREEKEESKGGSTDDDDDDDDEKNPLPPPIELAVAAHVAVTSGDGLALARLHRSHPASSWRARALMAPALERGLLCTSSSSSSPPPPPPPPSPSPPLPVRGGYAAALAALAASYRSLPVAVATRLLGLPPSDSGGFSLALLVEAARARGDRWALAAKELPPLSAEGGGELKFK